MGSTNDGGVWLETTKKSVQIDNPLTGRAGAARTERRSEKARAGEGDPWCDLRGAVSAPPGSPVGPPSGTGASSVCVGTRPMSAGRTDEARVRKGRGRPGITRRPTATPSPRSPGPPTGSASARNWLLQASHRASNFRNTGPGLDGEAPRPGALTGRYAPSAGGVRNSPSRVTRWAARNEGRRRAPRREIPRQRRRSRARAFARFPASRRPRSADNPVSRVPSPGGTPRRAPRPATDPTTPRRSRLLRERLGCRRAAARVDRRPAADVARDRAAPRTWPRSRDRRPDHRQARPDHDPAGSRPDARV
jgi:hypothetical protein